MTDFEQQVLADLSELKTHMRWLIGNGNPGKVRQLEARVEEHERYVQRAAGIGAAVAFVLTVLHVALEYLRLP